MAKKKSKKNELIKSNNSIITELRNDRWIYNPVVYSQISGDFTLLQQRILVGIVEKLQQRILDSVDEQKKTRIFPALFDESELAHKQTIELNIHADDLGVLPSNYVQLQQAAEALGRIQMKYPRYDSKGRVKSHVVASLFPRIEMPVYQKTIDGEDVEGKRTGILRVVMLTENIRDIFSMKYGYIKHISHIARLALKKRTPRLYIYLSRYKSIGHKKVPYQDLIEYLGLTDEYYFQQNYGGDDKKETTTNPYSSWSKVKQLVIEPVREEIKSLADNGDIDFSFEYEPIFPEGKTRGIPLEVLFTIKPSQMGEEKMKQDKRTNAIYDFVDKYINWCPDLSNLSLLALVEDLDDEQLSRFIKFAFTDVKNIVERKQPDDVASYVMGILKKWKRETIRAKQESIQQDLFAAEEERRREEERKRQEEFNREYPGMFADEWKQLLERCSPEYREWLDKAIFRGGVRENILVHFHTRTECEAFNKFEDKNKRLKDEFEKLYREIMKKPHYGPGLIRGFDEYR